MNLKSSAWNVAVVMIAYAIRVVATTTSDDVSNSVRQGTWSDSGQPKLMSGNPNGFPITDQYSRSPSKDADLLQPARLPATGQSNSRLQYYTVDQHVQQTEYYSEVPDDLLVSMQVADRLRDNAVFIFGYLLQSAASRLTSRQYAALKMIYKALQKKEIHMYQLLSALIKSSGQSKTIQFTALMTGLSEYSPQYYSCSATFWITQINGKAFDVNVVDNDLEGFDLFHGISQKDLQVIKPANIDDLVRPDDQDLKLTGMLIGRVFIKVFASFRVNKLNLSQKLFAIILRNLPVPEVGVLFQEYVEFVSEVAWRDKIPNWEQKQSNLNCSEPYTLITLMTHRICSDVDVSVDIKEAMAYIEDHFVNQQNYHILTQEFHSVTERENLNVTSLLSIITTHEFNTHAVKLKDDLLDFCRTNKIDIQNAMKGMNRYGFTKTEDLLISFLTRLRMRISSVMYPKIRQTVANLLAIVQIKLAAFDIIRSSRTVPVWTLFEVLNNTELYPRTSRHLITIVTELSQNFEIWTMVQHIKIPDEKQCWEPETCLSIYLIEIKKRILAKPRKFDSSTTVSEIDELLTSIIQDVSYHESGGTRVVNVPERMKSIEYKRKTPLITGNTTFLNPNEPIESSYEYDYEPINEEPDVQDRLGAEYELIDLESDDKHHNEAIRQSIVTTEKADLGQFYITTIENKITTPNPNQDADLLDIGGSAVQNSRQQDYDGRRFKNKIKTMNPIQDADSSDNTRHRVMPKKSSRKVNIEITTEHETLEPKPDRSHHSHATLGSMVTTGEPDQQGFYETTITNRVAVAESNQGNYQTTASGDRVTSTKGTQQASDATRLIITRNNNSENIPEYHVEMKKSSENIYDMTTPATDNPKLETVHDDHLGYKPEPEITSEEPASRRHNVENQHGLENEITTLNPNVDADFSDNPRDSVTESKELESKLDRADHTRSSLKSMVTTEVPEQENVYKTTFDIQVAKTDLNQENSWTTVSGRSVTATKAPQQVYDATTVKLGGNNDLKNFPDYQVEIKKSSENVYDTTTPVSGNVESQSVHDRHDGDKSEFKRTSEKPARQINDLDSSENEISTINPVEDANLSDNARDGVTSKKSSQKVHDEITKESTQLESERDTGDHTYVSLESMVTTEVPEQKNLHEMTSNNRVATTDLNQENYWTTAYELRVTPANPRQQGYGATTLKLNQNNDSENITEYHVEVKKSTENVYDTTPASDNVEPQSVHDRHEGDKSEFERTSEKPARLSYDLDTSGNEITTTNPFEDANLSDNSRDGVTSEKSSQEEHNEITKESSQLESERDTGDHTDVSLESMATTEVPEQENLHEMTSNNRVATTESNQENSKTTDSGLCVTTINPRQQVYDAPTLKLNQNNDSENITEYHVEVKKSSENVYDATTPASDNVEIQSVHDRDESDKSEFKRTSEKPERRSNDLDSFESEISTINPVEDANLSDNSRDGVTSAKSNQKVHDEITKKSTQLESERDTGDHTYVSLESIVTTEGPEHENLHEMTSNNRVATTDLNQVNSRTTASGLRVTTTNPRQQVYDATTSKLNQNNDSENITEYHVEVKKSSENVYNATTPASDNVELQSVHDRDEGDKSEFERTSEKPERRSNDLDSFESEISTINPVEDANLSDNSRDGVTSAKSSQKVHDEITKKSTQLESERDTGDHTYVSLESIVTTEGPEQENLHEMTSNNRVATTDLNQVNSRTTASGLRVTTTNPRQQVYDATTSKLNQNNDSENITEYHVEVNKSSENVYNATTPASDNVELQSVHDRDEGDKSEFERTSEKPERRSNDLDSFESEISTINPVEDANLSDNSRDGVTSAKSSQKVHDEITKKSTQLESERDTGDHTYVSLESIVTTEGPEQENLHEMTSNNRVATIDLNQVNSQTTASGLRVTPTNPRQQVYDATTSKLNQTNDSENTTEYHVEVKKSSENVYNATTPASDNVELQSVHDRDEGDKSELTNVDDTHEVVPESMMTTKNVDASYTDDFEIEVTTKLDQYDSREKILWHDETTAEANQDTQYERLREYEGARPNLDDVDFHDEVPQSAAPANNTERSPTITFGDEPTTTESEQTDDWRDTLENNTETIDSASRHPHLDTELAEIKTIIPATVNPHVHIQLTVSDLDVPSMESLVTSKTPTQMDNVVNLPSLACLQQDPSTVDTVEDCKDDFDVRVTQILTETFGVNYRQVILGIDSSSDYSTELSYQIALLRKAQAYSIIINTVEYRTIITRYEVALQSVSAYLFLPLAIDYQNIRTEVIWLTYDMNHPSQAHIESEHSYVVENDIIALPLINPKSWLLPVDVMRPLSHLIPNLTDAESSFATEIQIFTRLISTEDIYKLLGFNWRPSSFPNRGALFITTLYTLLTVKEVKDNVRLYKLVQHYIKAITLSSINAGLSRDYIETTIRQWQIENQNIIPNFDREVARVIYRDDILLPALIDPKKVLQVVLKNAVPTFVEPSKYIRRPVLDSLTLPSVNCLQALSDYREEDSYCENFPDIYVINSVAEKLGDKYIDYLLETNNYPTVAAFLNHLFIKAVTNKTIAMNQELVADIERYQMALHFAASLIFLPMLANWQHIDDEVVWLSYDTTYYPHSHVSRHPAKEDGNTITLPIINPKIWLQSVNIEHPFSSFIPNLPANSIHASKIRPLAELFNSDEIFELLGKDWSRGNYPNRGALFLTTLQTLLSSKRVQSNEQLHALVQTYSDVIRTVSLYVHIPRSWINDGFKKANYTWDIDFEDLITAVPSGQRHGIYFYSLKAFLLTDNLLNVLRIKMPSSTTYKANLLVMIITRALNSTDISMSAELKEALQYYDSQSELILVAGGGVVKWVWVPLHIKVRSTKTITFNIGEIFTTAIPLSQLKDKRSKIEYFKVIRFMINNKNLLKADDFKWSRYHSYGQILRAYLNHLMHRQNISNSVKNSIAVVVKYVRNMGPGAMHFPRNRPQGEFNNIK